MDRRAARGRKLGACWEGLAERQPRRPRPQPQSLPHSAPGLPSPLTLQHADHTCWPHPGHLGEAQGVWGAPDEGPWPLLLPPQLEARRPSVRSVSSRGPTSGGNGEGWAGSRPRKAPPIPRCQEDSERQQGLRAQSCPYRLQNKHLRSSGSSPVKWGCYCCAAVSQKPSMAQNRWFCCRAEHN